MGDEVTNVVVEPPAPVAETPSVSPSELWHAEHEARHVEHMAHLESIREEHRSEINRLEQRISDLEGRIVVVETAPSESGGSIGDALETVAVVGETIADINAAMQEPVIEEPPAPPRSENNGGPGPETEVQPDVATGQAAPANTEGRRRRGSRLW